MTKAELIRAIKRKVRKVNPMVKKIFFRGMQYRTKSELERILKKARVTREGDISLL